MPVLGMVDDHTPEGPGENPGPSNLKTGTEWIANKTILALKVKARSHFY
jgi:hypothetical protein